MGYSFNVTNSRQFFNLLEHAVSKYLEDDMDVSNAMMCAMFSFHLTDWLNKEVNNNGDLGAFRASLNCPSLSIMHDIINGTKHFTLDSGRDKAVANTEFNHGEYSDEYSREYNVKSLDIILKDGTTVRFRETIIEVTNFWRNYFNTIHPS